MNFQGRIFVLPRDGPSSNSSGVRVGGTGVGRREACGLIGVTACMQMCVSIGVTACMQMCVSIGPAKDEGSGTPVLTGCICDECRW